MHFGSAISTRQDLAAACAEAGALARAKIDAPIDLCVAFVSAAFRDLDRVPALLAQAVGARCLIGCTGGGIIGGGEEVEDRAAVSVTVASLPGVTLRARHHTDDTLPSADAPPSEWVRATGCEPGATAGFIVLPEPFRFAADRLLAGLDYAFPDTPKVGGIASAPPQSADVRLFIDGEAPGEGAVILGLAGDLVVETRVAQGCRPFGRIGRITRAESNYLHTIDGRKAIEFLQEQLQRLEGDDVELAQSTPLFLGIASDPFDARQPGPGDFLVRNMIGYDAHSGAILIGDLLSPGRLVQFHLRDRHCSATDLRTILGTPCRPAPSGALLFSCLGRGRHLYGEAGHDSRVFREVVGPVPLGGFFCNGEIGPVQASTHLHGYTSSFALFRDKHTPQVLP